MSHPIRVVMYQDNTQSLTIIGLQDTVTGNFWNTATVTATLVDQDGNQVPGCVGVTLNYIPLSDGQYQGIVGAGGFSPEIGGGYVLIVDADQNPSHGHWEFQTEIQARTF